ncbi:hypothetical protein SDC9_104991 [bioreactor metagenome]|uniref:Uncharacterized protein n=1 Tax=bioreactor metagenome TaxID=1076179 RepID=A0A645AY14_9ZZZZ
MCLFNLSLYRFIGYAVGFICLVKGLDSGFGAGRFIGNGLIQILLQVGIHGGSDAFHGCGLFLFRKGEALLMGNRHGQRGIYQLVKNGGMRFLNFIGGRSIDHAIARVRFVQVVKLGICDLHISHLGHHWIGNHRAAAAEYQGRQNQRAYAEEGLVVLHLVRYLLCAVIAY